MAEVSAFPTSPQFSRTSRTRFAVPDPSRRPSGVVPPAPSLPRHAASAGSGRSTPAPKGGSLPRQRPGICTGVRWVRRSSTSFAPTSGTVRSTSSCRTAPSVFERGEMTTVVRWINEIPRERAGGEHRPPSAARHPYRHGRRRGDSRGPASRRSRPRGVHAWSGGVCPQFPGRPGAVAPPAAVVDRLRGARTRRARRSRRRPDPRHPSSHRSPFPRIRRSGVGRQSATSWPASLTDARDWLERGLASEGALYSVWRVHTLGSLALLEAWEGETLRAAELAREALSLAERHRNIRTSRDR